MNKVKQRVSRSIMALALVAGLAVPAATPAMAAGQSTSNGLGYFVNPHYTNGTNDYQIWGGDLWTANGTFVTSSSTGTPNPSNGAYKTFQSNGLGAVRGIQFDSSGSAANAGGYDFVYDPSLSDPTIAQYQKLSGADPYFFKTELANASAVITDSSNNNQIYGYYASSDIWTLSGYHVALGPLLPNGKIFPPPYPQGGVVSAPEDSTVDQPTIIGYPSISPTLSTTTAKPNQTVTMNFSYSAPIASSFGGSSSIAAFWYFPSTSSWEEDTATQILGDIPSYNWPSPALVAGTGTTAATQDGIQDGYQANPAFSGSTPDGYLASGYIKGNQVVGTSGTDSLDLTVPSNAPAGQADLVVYFADSINRYVAKSIPVTVTAAGITDAVQQAPYNGATTGGATSTSVGIDQYAHIHVQGTNLQSGDIVTVQQQNGANGTLYGGGVNGGTTYAVSGNTGTYNYYPTAESGASETVTYAVSDQNGTNNPMGQTLTVYYKNIGLYPASTSTATSTADQVSVKVDNIQNGDTIYLTQTSDSTNPTISGYSAGPTPETSAAKGVGKTIVFSWELLQGRGLRVSGHGDD